MASICLRCIMQIALHKEHFAWMFFFAFIFEFFNVFKVYIQFDQFFRNSEISCLFYVP